MSLPQKKNSQDSQPFFIEPERDHVASTGFIPRFWQKLRGPANKLGNQITFLVALSLLFMIVSVGVSTFYMADRWISRDYKSYTVAVGSMLADNVRVGVLVNSPYNAQQAINIAASYDAVSQVAAYGQDGQLLASMMPEDDWRSVDIQRFSSLSDAYLEEDSEKHWQYLLPVLNDSAEPELEDQEALRKAQTLIGYLRIRVIKEHFVDTRNSVAQVNTLVLVVVAALLLVTLRALTGALTKPLEEFVQTMRQGASSGEHHPRLNLEGSTEIKQLSESFNHMMQVLEERKIELQEARDEALTAARLKAEFAANVSHEIRTPLNGIMGTLHLLSDSTLTQDQREYISLAESASKGLIAMIDAILDFSRLTLDQATLSNRPFDLPELLEELLSLHAKSYNFKPLDFLFYYDDTLPSIVESDEDKIRQLLNNLLNNATKFTDSGSIELRVKCESENDGQVWINIAVKDTGIGLSEKEKRSIFQPYQQTDGTMSRKHGGTGLGLAICEKLTELLGGDIGVDSITGVGSEFYVRLPFRIPSASSSPALPLKSINALVVSSSASIRESIINLCRRSGMQVSSCTSLSELINILRKQCPDTDRFLVIIYPSVVDDCTQFWDSAKRVLDSFDMCMLAVTRLANSAWQTATNVRVILPPVRRAMLEKAVQPVFQAASATDSKEVLLLDRLDVQESSDVRSYSVLLVEDNPINSIVTSRMLEKANCTVVAVENGRDALAEIKGRSFDLVLMDCQLPGINGYEVTRRIRALGGQYEGLPVVAITANVDRQERQQCFDAGMDDFVGKPVDADDLYRILTRWCKESE